MEKLKDNQILLEISEDKKQVTVQVGHFYPITYDSCPAIVIKDMDKAIEAYFKETGLVNHPQWTNEKCGYNGGKCFDCD